MCKECHIKYVRDSKLKRKREDGEGVDDDDDDDDDDDGGEPTEPAASEVAGMADDLYVMQNSRISDEVKIGRSKDPEKRRKALLASQNYRMNILAVFPEAGHIETQVHSMLSYCRVTEVPGREWFRCSTQMAFAAIGGALAAQKKN